MRFYLSCDIFSWTKMFSIAIYYVDISDIEANEENVATYIESS